MSKPCIQLQIALLHNTEIKKKTFLTKEWVMDNEIQVFWIYTETGHGKGPMDGVGAAVKKFIKDTCL